MTKSTLVGFAFRDGEGGVFVGLDTTRRSDLYGVPIVYSIKKQEVLLVIFCILDTDSHCNRQKRESIKLKSVDNVPFITTGTYLKHRMNPKGSPYKEKHSKP